MTKYIYFTDRDGKESVVMFSANISHDDMCRQLGVPSVHSAGHVKILADKTIECIIGSNSLGIPEKGIDDYVSRYANSSFMFGGV